MKTFVPQRLIESKKAVVAQHADTAEVQRPESDAELRGLIYKIVQLRHSGIKMHACALTGAEVKKIAWYIPVNFYHVDLKNLIEVFRIRCSVDACDTLFQSWQQYYCEVGCIPFVLSFFDGELLWKEYMLKKHWNKKTFERVAYANSVPIQFGRLCYGNEDLAGKPFEERMDYYGVIRGSQLFLECRRLRLAFCDRCEFDLLGQSEILKLLQSYDEQEAREFIWNYLSVYELAELKKKAYMPIVRYMITITGEPGSLSWKKFFADFLEELEKKYLYWVNVYKIDEIFGNDERSNFWRDYQYESVRRYWYSDSVVMEFKNHYITEFLGRANGPMYVYGKNGDFDSRVRYWFEVYNNAEIRSKLYHNRYLALERKEHRPNPGWEYRFKCYLENEKIAQLI